MCTTLIICFLFMSLMYIPVNPQNPFMKKTSGYNKFLASKSPYRYVGNMDTSQFVYQGCEPKKIWMVIRHGTRYPSMKYVKGMMQKLPIIKQQIVKNAVNLTSDELNKIRNWQPFVKEEDEKKLTHEGEDEMIELAERMQLRFSKLLPKIYSSTTFKFRYTATQRTEESARNFATGLFGRATSDAVWYPPPMYRDPILRFYKLCAKWRKEVKKNPDAIIQRTLFNDGPHMKATLKELKAKLGIDFNYTDAHLMYMTCAFETAWNKYKLSPWCSTLTTDAFKVMEYSEDLKYYWIDGYGYPLTYLQACPAIKNMVEFFESKEEYPKAVLYFTHSGTVLKLLAHLGLYKDEVSLLHNNYTEQADRQWRVSKIDAFGSNIAVVLYRCGEVDKMLFLHQERPVRLPSCLESDLCDFNTFVNAFNESIKNCNFDEMCHND